MAFPSVLSATLVIVLFLSLLAAGSTHAATLKIPLSVRAAGESPTVSVPVWTGVPLPASAVRDVAALRLLDADGKAVPAQFDIEATWPDGSAKWVLVSFLGAGAPGKGQAFTVTSDAAVAAPAVPNAVDVFDDTNECSVTTGPMRFRINKHSPRGLSQVWLDINADHKFGNDEMISNENESAGLVAIDDAGRLYSSGAGDMTGWEVERQGPVHVVLAMRGNLRSKQRDAGEPLLNYTMRIHAFAGSPLVRMVVTVHNPRAARRAEDGSRWVLGQAGGVLFKGLDYIQPVRLTEGLRQVTLSLEPDKMLDRIPLAGPIMVYQDSSGGTNWFHRSHVNRDSVIPLKFRGYKVYYQDRQIESGLRANPWVDVADMKWAVSAAMPDFWQNCPKALEVDEKGAIRISLWPKEFGDLHELQGGEQKSHEFWLYFRHRQPLEGRSPEEKKEQRRDQQRQRREVTFLPLDREMMPVCLQRPVVLAAAETYAGALDPTRPVESGRFAGYEAMVAAAIKGSTNLYTHREEADEYGWRNFGDTWAANEINQTGGPHTGLRMVSHYNNEYDLGFGMLMQALRNADADPKLAKAWWDLARPGLWHEADIDIYHTLLDQQPIYNGGLFTHTAHGVEAGRSTHRAAPTDDVWGVLDWSWARGGCPEAGHFRSRGILSLYYVTGDRHLRDAAWDMTQLVDYKIRANRFPQIDAPNRDGGNNLQVLLDWYLLTWDPKFLEPIEKLTTSLDFDAVAGRAGNPVGGAAWSTELYVKSLGRLIEAFKDKAVPTDKLEASHLKYCRAIYEQCYARSGSWREGTWSYLACEVMMQAADLAKDPAEKAKFVQAAKDAFHALDGWLSRDGVAPFSNSKSTTMLLQGGGRYMLHAAEHGEPAASTQPARGQGRGRAERNDD